MSGPGMKTETSFYVTGGTLQRDAPCYVVRRADTELYEGLTRGEFCYVLTPRQMGKSSLMVRTAAHLSEDGAGVAVLDLTAIGQNLNAEQWYGGLLSQLGRRLDLEDELVELWAARPKLSPLQRWMEAIRDVVLRRYCGRVVIFVDEIDAVRSLPFSTDEFFAGIREFYNRRAEQSHLERLTFCLLGVATPSDLIRDMRTTPFNIGQRIELRDFTNTEAAPLAQGLGRVEATGAALTERVLYWTGGHPYLTQRLCQAIAEDASVIDSTGVDRACAELFFTWRAREQDDNLLFVRERMLRSEVDMASLLTLYGQVHRHKKVIDETSPLVSILRLSGIVRTEGGYLKVRNRIYARVFDKQWVKASMPDVELRRQRAAFRRGVLRATAVAAVILVMIIGLALIALRQRNLAQEEAHRADSNLQQANMNAEMSQAALAEAEGQKQVAEMQGAEAEKQREEAVSQREFADEQRNRAEQQEQANRRLLYTAHMPLAQQAYEDTDIQAMEGLLNSHVPKAGQEDLRGFEWYYLWRLIHSGQIISRRNGAVYSVAFSPDDTTLAIGGEDQTVTLWDLKTRYERAAFKMPGGVIYSLAFSPNGKTLAVASGQTVELRDAATNQKTATLLGHTDAVRSVVFSRDGKLLATGSNDGTVILWDLNKGQAQNTLKGHRGFVGSVAFSPDGKRLATASYDNSAKLWDVATGVEVATLTGHNDVVYCLAFSPDGRRMITGGKDIRVWDVATHQRLAILKGHRSIVQCLMFSPDGKILAAAGMDNVVILWDVATQQELTTFKGHTTTIWSLAFSNDGKTLATGSQDHTARLWDVGSGREEQAYWRDRRGFKPLRFSPDGQILAMRSEDEKTLKLYDVIRRQELGIFKVRVSTISTSVAISTQERTVAVGIDDNSVILWNADARKRLPTLKGHGGSISAVAFSPDGKTLATGSYDQTAKLWDVATGRLLTTFTGHKGAIKVIEFSKNGRTLVTGALDIVKVWDVTTGRQTVTLLGHLKPVWASAFSPDGKTLATVSDDETVKLWDVAIGQELATFKAHKMTVISVAFSPDGKRIATGSADNTVKLWDLVTGQSLITLKAHTSAVTSVVFSADGKTLGSISLGGNVRLWHAAADLEVKEQAR